MSQQAAQTPTLDEAIAITVEYLRAMMAQGTGPRGNYGYDLWAPSVVNAWTLAACGTETLRRESAARRASPMFFEAAWELCRRGVLRPGIRETGGQAVSGGLGYSLTAQGREWLFSGNSSHFVMLQPGALAAALATHRERFGEGYHQRAQEAVRCRDAEAWYSACAMVGAAAESIVLATAVAKTGNEAAVLKGYASANGQKKLLNDLAPATKPHLARPLATVTGLLAYWRDEAAHATATPISGLETEQALRELLQFAHFVNENWDDLTLSAKAASAKAAAKSAEAKTQSAAAPSSVSAAREPVSPAVAAAPGLSGAVKPETSFKEPVEAKTMVAEPNAPLPQAVPAGAAAVPELPPALPDASSSTPAPNAVKAAYTTPSVDPTSTATPEPVPSKPSDAVTGPTAFMPVRTGGLPIRRDPSPAPDAPDTDSVAPAEACAGEETPGAPDANPETPADPEAETPPAAPAVANSRRWW